MRKEFQTSAVYQASLKATVEAQYRGEQDEMLNQKTAQPPVKRRACEEETSDQENMWEKLARMNIKTTLVRESEERTLAETAEHATFYP